MVRQQQLGYQCQQQPTDEAVHSYSESADASSASKAQPTVGYRTSKHSARTSRCRSHMQQGPRPNAPTSQNAPAQGSHNDGACFKCGLTGHFA
jgi:hypothetical protein